MRYVIAVLLAVLLLVALQSYARHIAAQMEIWASLGRELTLAERLSMGFSTFWRAFYWIAAPFILAGSILLAALTRPRAKASAQAAR